MERVSLIESLAPSIEATIQKVGNDFVVTVQRMADDGWEGWQFDKLSPKRSEAIDDAMAEVKARIMEEASR